MNIIDNNFGINYQALGVMQYLKTYELTANEPCPYPRAETKPWYNGRECGIMISFMPDCGPEYKCLNIAFFEHRNSDEICTLKWETENMYWNWPDENVFELAYHGKTKWDVAARFGYGEVNCCAKWVYEEIQKYYEDVCKTKLKKLEKK